MPYSKLLITAMVMVLSLVSVSSATLIKFHLQGGEKIDRKYISHIHFNAGGNNFWGLIARSDSVDVDEQEVIWVTWTSNNDTINCSQQVRGVYYNAQRGERLWPLDTITAFGGSWFWWLGYSSTGLTMSGGLYTSCTGDINGFTGNHYWIFGQLTHTFDGVDYSLLAGVKYEPEEQRNIPASGSSLAYTLERLDNTYPLGFIYDNNGGLGFVGCQIKSSFNEIIKGLNQSGTNYFFTLSGKTVPVPINSSLSWALDCSKAGVTLDQLLLIKIQGIVGLSTDTEDQGVEALGGNQAEESKTQFFSTVNVNNATLINQAKRTAENLCRGKWDTKFSLNGDVLCWDIGGSNKPDHTVLVEEIKGKTLVAKGGTLTLEGKMETSNDNLDIFVDKGILRLTWDPADRINFNTNGFPVQSGDISSIASGIYLKGNFIINGLIDVANKFNTNVPRFFIYGKFTSLNTYAKELADNRVKQLSGLLLNQGITSNDINLNEVFKRRCNTYLGVGSDGSSCSSIDGSGKNISFSSSPLIIIGQEYPSKLLN